MMVQRDTFQSSILLPLSLLIFFLPIAASVSCCAQEEESDRPHLAHEPGPNQPYDPRMEPVAPAIPETPIGDGLALLSIGHVWARDTFKGQPQLVQLRFLPTEVNQHALSNAVKVNMAPFIYKPKTSIEVEGATASVRLHDPHLSIYIRGFEDNSQDAAPAKNTSTQTELAIVKVEPKKDRRIISTIAFTQFTGTAKRNNESIAFTVQKVDHSDWQKIVPDGPLPPGEYALMCMPRGQNLLPSQIFDFGVDPDAPANPDAVIPSADVHPQ